MFTYTYFRLCGIKNTEHTHKAAFHPSQPQTTGAYDGLIGVASPLRTAFHADMRHLFAGSVLNCYFALTVSHPADLFQCCSVEWLQCKE